MANRILVQSKNEMAKKAPEEEVYNLVLDVGDESAVVIHGTNEIDDENMEVSVSVVTRVGYIDEDGDPEDGEFPEAASDGFDAAGDGPVLN